MKNEALLTTPEVAEKLGITLPRVHQLIQKGRLPSTRYGRTHLINESDLALVADRKPGRPPSAERKPALKRAAKPAKKARGRK